MKVPTFRGSAPQLTTLGQSADGTAVGRIAGGRKRGRTRLVALLCGLVVVLAAAYFGYSRLSAAPAPVQPTLVQAQRGTITTTVSATGTVAPLNQAKLSFTGSGRVSEVMVKVGDAVKKGQPLASLDSSDLKLSLSQAKASLSSAQAKLATIKAGSRPEDIKAAQTQLDAAKSKLDAMQAGGRSEDVASAQAALDSAKAKLNQLTSGPTDADVRAAEQGVSSAQAALVKAQSDLAKLKNGPTPEDLKAAQLAVDQARNSLWSQQISRDGTCGRGGGYQCDAANASVASAETAVQNAQNSLAKVQAPPSADDVAAAEHAVQSAQAQLDSAQAKLNQVKAGANPDDVKAAQAAVTQAEQALALKQKPYTDADIQAQQQAVAQAQANLVAKQTPYTDADVQSAQAAVDQAQAQLDQAQHALDNATLAAPFDGVVGSVAVNPGEAASGPVITLVDPSNLRLDVSVDESDIAKLALGQRATVTFDAITGKNFQGKVTGVAPSATIQSGVAIYTVSIGITDPGSVKAGMTGNATIVYGEQQNALLVPNRAIKTVGRNRVVEVMVNGKQESRTVTTGLSNDQLTEITGGLAEGDEVVISGTTTSGQRNGAAGAAGAMMPAGGRGGPVIVGPGGRGG